MLTPFEAGERDALANFRWENDLFYADAELEAWDKSAVGIMINAWNWLQTEVRMPAEVHEWMKGYGLMRDQLLSSQNNS